jgi:hypothetical protein
MKNPLEQLANSHNDVANKGCLDWITGELKIIGILAIIAISITAALIVFGEISSLGFKPLPETDEQSLKTFAQIAFSILTKGGF